MTAHNVSIQERFLAKINKTDFCWVWVASLDINGYGQMTVNKKHVRAFRLAYQLYKGSISEGLVVRHTCDNPSCVNPDHLELGTQRDNVQDCIERGRYVYNIKNLRPGNLPGITRIKCDVLLEIYRSKKSKKALVLEYGFDRKTIYKIQNLKHPYGKYLLEILNEN